ncbi:helix-turn-helix domain-containing protein [Exiguobacterium sp. s191]|uniref:helix-turn-helix domain-containing protein n=1 Tax=Exiguobacterium sp. s191 TaxID=2751196 RepID=UPI001BEC13F9|nr:helix-turn-helix domain-containing protein [Exiguobacterium sp. s191]
MLFNEQEFKRMIADGIAESLAAIARKREYLTVPEVCEELRCSRSMIDKQIRENGLPITRVDGKIIIRREHLYKWLDQRVECNDWNQSIEGVKRHATV